MKEKITLPVLTQMLALRTGDTKKQAEDFLKEFFGTLSAALVEGEQVKIKEIGVFKTVAVEARKSVNVSTGSEHEIPAHRKVSFVASKEMAARVNEPFEMFETVELNDDVLLDNEDEIAEVLTFDAPHDLEIITPAYETTENPEPEPEEEQVEVEQEIPEEEEEVEVDETDDEEDDDDDEVDQTEDETQIEVPIIEEPVIEEPVVEEPVAEQPEVEEPVEEESAVLKEPKVVEEPEVEQKPRKSHFWTGFICGFLVAALFAAVGYLWMKYPGFNFCSGNDAKEQVVTEPTPKVEKPEVSAEQPKVADNQQTTSSTEPNTAAEPAPEEAAPTTPSDAPVYDVIGTKRYLTTMSKDHYGNYHFWPYIYEENKDIISHPSRIKPGTRVRIPDLRKYGVDPTSKKDLEIAKKKEAEIYSRYPD